ncbi:MAG: hypothetical protein IPO27_05085 [Bacteroidetes bacterium]|nr:hypothetical protein [Bacteroidota bacterium]
MLKILKTSPIFPLIFMVVCGISGWALGFTRYFRVDTTADTLVAQWLMSYFQSLPHRITIIILTSLVILQGFYLNYIMNRNEVLYKNSWLPSVFYVLIMGLFARNFTFSIHIVVISLILIVLNNVFRLYKLNEAKSLNFDTGVLIGVIACLQPQAALLIVFYCTVMFILRAVVLRDILIACLGFTLPYLTVATTCFILDIPMSFDRITGFKAIGVSIPFVDYYHKVSIFTLVLLLFCLTISLLKLSGNFYKNVIRTRNMQQVLFILSIFGIAYIFAFPNENSFRYTLFIVPLSALVSYYFVAARRWLIAEILFTLIIGLMYFKLYKAS